MGEAADMLLNGLLCECCGELIDGEEPGFPRYCSAECVEARGAGTGKPWPPEGASREGFLAKRRRRRG